MEAQAEDAAAPDPTAGAEQQAPAGAAAAAQLVGACAGAEGDADSELDAAALALDQHSRLLRADLLARLLDWRRRAGERQRALEAAGERAAAEQAAVRQQLATANAELARQREVLRRVGDALFRAARWRRQHTLGCMAWRAWREHTRRQRQVQARMCVAAQHYDVGRLRRRVLAAWRHAAAAAARVKVKAQAAALREAKEEREQHAASAAQQAQQLAELEAALAAALAARSGLEQGMRRAFMRGVCALNIEAAALLKPGPDGSASAPAQHEQQHLQHQGAAGAFAAVPGIADLSLPAGTVAQGQPHLPSALDQNSMFGGAQAAAAGAPPPLSAEQWTAAASAPQASFIAAGLPAEGARLHAAGGWPTAAGWLQHASRGSAAASSLIAAHPSSTHAEAAGHVCLKPMAVQPHPLVSLAPTQPVPPALVLPSGQAAQAMRHITSATSGAALQRPATALAPVPCSLPSNVPAHMASVLANAAKGIPCTSATRPITAPVRRQHHTAALAAAVAAGPPPLQVSRRSLAGEKGHTVGVASSNVQPLVVRGAVPAGAGAQAAAGCKGP